MKIHRAIRYAFAGALFFASAYAGATDSKTVEWALNELSLNYYTSQCNQYSGRTVVIVRSSEEAASSAKYERLATMYERGENTGLIVLGEASSDSTVKAISSSHASAYCQVTYEMHSPIFTSSAEPNNGVSGSSGGSPVNVEASKMFRIYYPIAEDGTLVTEFSSASKADDAELVESIEAALTTS